MQAFETTTWGKLPALRIVAADGAQATVTLYGAHLVSWKSADGKERLFCSAQSAMDGSAAIRGGVPVIFPQFSTRGTGLRHGFARISNWRPVPGAGRAADGSAQISLALDESDLAPALAAAWPQRFSLTMRFSIHGDELRMAFDVRNTGAEAFSYSCALHSYWLMDDIGNVAIRGVAEGELTLPAKHDHVYFGIGGDIGLRDGSTALALEQSGFTDAVVWNPGAADAAALADMADEEYRRFVCIEPALIGPATLAPGAAWTGTHRVQAD
jgi:glucose-6-phosphate 1-epimerase